MRPDPVAVELNVDAALLLQSLTGIDSYPEVLVLMPNVFDFDDAARVRQTVSGRLEAIGIVAGGRVHPRVEHWLRCLYRPDIEIAARAVDNEVDIRHGRRRPRSMLRMSLVRAADTHVLALRCNDDIVIQEVYAGDRPLQAAAAAIRSALGPVEPLEFDPITAPLTQFTDMPHDRPDDMRRMWRKLGATQRSAAVLTAIADVVVRAVDIVVIEHHEGGSTETPTGASVFDTPAGRVVALPSKGVDGRLWCTFTPGEDQAVEQSLVSLVSMLPCGSWSANSRSA